MIGRKLLDIMLIEGARIPLYDQKKVMDDFDRAVREKTFYVLREGNDVAGFFSYFKEGNKIFVNNLVVYKKFRKRTSLLKARHFIRKAFEGIEKIEWESKRRGNKLCQVR